jgi:hypothetical protein
MRCLLAALDVDYDTRSGVTGLADVYNDDAIVPRIGYRTALDRNHTRPRRRARS